MIRCIEQTRIQREEATAQVLLLADTAAELAGITTGVDVESLADFVKIAEGSVALVTGDSTKYVFTNNKTWQKWG